VDSVLVVRLASVEELRPVTLRVLRPDGPLPGDRPPPPDWLHLVAESDGAIVGGCSVGPAEWSHPELLRLPRPTWQLRSMAVLPEHRGGTGGVVLRAATEQAFRAGAASMWANARTASITLYTRGGWRIVGDEWVKPGVGPHRYVVREYAPNDADS